MVAHAALDAQPKRADLARRRTVRIAPHARIAIEATGFDAVAGAGVDHRLLEGADERTQQEIALGELDDRVANQLPGPVIGHFTATLDANHLDTA